ncbi:cysteine dioxygenase [Phenylobacterium immobile]|uniref:cysteine dioxygenase family protein n=1 Tax=Phenylobacterium immobile TaxID=21 RepID=UPI000B13B9D0|nr:cysteine dioxygenase [Phenylobacterium immobile]
MTSQPKPSALAQAIEAIEMLILETSDEARLLQTGAEILGRLVAQDDWLDPRFAQADASRYRQYLLHRDPDARFSLVSFVWGPGQATPIHDHTVWGLVAMLRGSEYAQPYVLDADGLRTAGPVQRLEPGDVEAVSPRIGDIHRVWNAYDDRVSISIHLYGADIGAVSRHTYDASGAAKTFISGYSELS